jgi:hypothetical protein
LDECQTGGQLKNWLKINGDFVEALDGAESRTFEEIYNAKEAALAALDNVTSGA